MITDSDDRIYVTREEYQELLDDSLFLQCLRNGGVDNWDWYDEAVREFWEIKEGEDE